MAEDDQANEADWDFPERRSPDRSTRVAPGRRSTDQLPQRAVNRLTLITVIVCIDAVYLVGGAILHGPTRCGP